MIKTPAFWRNPLVFLLIVVGALLARPVGAGMINVQPDGAVWHLGAALEYAFDPSGDVGIAAVASGTAGLAFSPDDTAVPHLGFSSAPLWLRVAIRNDGDRPFEGVLVYKFPYLDRIELFVPREDGGFKRLVRGDSEPLDPALPVSSFPAFDIAIPAQSTITLYTRVTSTSVLMLPAELYTEAAFAKANLRDQLLFAMLFGIVLAVSLYVVTVYLTVREPAYPYFIAFSLSYAAYVAVSSGMGQIWLWPRLHDHANALYFVVQGLLFATGAQFFRRFLDTATHARAADLVMRVLVVAGVATMVAPALPRPIDTVLIAFVAGPGAVFVLITAVVLAWQGVHNARIAAIGWGFSHVTSVYLYVRIFDITPYTSLNHYLTAIGCAIATLFFAIALALGLRRQQERLLLIEAISETKSQFLAGMSHELRTPLNAIMGFSEMMDKEMLGPIRPEPYKDYVGDIHRSSQHLLRLVDDILDLSKIEAGKYELDHEDVDLNAIIADAVRMLGTVAERSRIDLRHDRAPGAIQVRADKRAVEQILLNLLGNALKFTGDGGRVVVRADVWSETVSFSVSDTGVGIAETDLQTVLRPFEQVRSNAMTAKKGAGLGIPLSKALVELHGGNLAIDSVLGRGTTVRVVLPRLPNLRDAPATAVVPWPMRWLRSHRAAH
ncbi:MAG: sensor histidine kinase [Inquilinaceae bacterium]